MSLTPYRKELIGAEPLEQALNNDPVVAALIDYSCVTDKSFIISKVWESTLSWPRTGFPCKHSLAITPVLGTALLIDGGRDGLTVDIDFRLPTSGELQEGAKAGISTDDVLNNVVRIALAELGESNSNLSRNRLADLLQDKARDDISILSLNRV